MISMMLMLAAAAPAAPTPAAVSTGAATAPMTTQQAFDQATTHAADGKCQEALPEFDALERRPGYKPETLAAAMISLLKGQCLVKTGRESDGERPIRQAIPRLRQQGAQFDVDIASALLTLGDAAIARWDYTTAKGRYEEAAALPNATNPVVMNVKLAQATAFDGGEAPLRYADAAIKGIEATADIPKSRIAEFRTIRARILLNQGRNAEAYAELKQVLKLTGGLDLKVSLADVAMRGDLALAAQLSGDEENARKYLAYTGAGRIEESPFTRATNMAVPTCGAQTGLRPDDFAVVDFAVNPQDGHVLSAQTVYTRGSAEVATQFAQAVSKWEWQPEDLKKIPPFFLLAPRIEIRCTTGGQQAPGTLAPLHSRFTGWATSQLDAIDLASNARALTPRLRVIADEAVAKGDAARQVAALGLLSLMAPEPIPDLHSWVMKALALADRPAVPAEVRNYLKISELYLRVSWYGSEKLLARANQSDFLPLLDNAGMKDDALAADTVRILAGTPSSRDRNPNGMLPLLQTVATDTRLPAEHPIRQIANLRLADEAARRRDFAAAQSYFKATGLTEEQCAFLGVTPVIRRGSLTSDDFPDSALAWGFEGWVQLEYDIQADGTTASARSLIAYPPFIFSRAAAKSIKGFVYQSSYRPSGNQTCAASSRTFMYRIAR